MVVETSEEKDRMLRDVWAEIRRKHLYPELPQPGWADEEERVAIDIRDKRISVSRPFVEELSQFLEPKEILSGLLDHAVSHYLHCPWDLSTHLKLYRESKHVLKDKQMAQKATGYFMDVVSDTMCMSRKETSLPELYRHLKRGIMDETVHALYQKIWGLDLGVKGYEEIARKLSRLPYLDRSKWTESVRKFSKIVQSLLEVEERFGGLNRPNPMGEHGLQQYSQEEIEQGLKEFAKEAASPAEFKEIVEDLQEELSEAMKPNERGMGLGPGGSIDADLMYYMKLAENYALPVRKTPMEKSGALYTHHHVPWEVGRPFQDIDPWTSFGKIMPGITQTWERREGEVFGREEGTPDCIVLIDSSGSMANPRQTLSYAVLGAACACDAYLRNDARVAVYNFSDAKAGGSQILPFTRHRMSIYRTLCHYFGGGTKLLVEDIEALQTPYTPDIFLITDMQITNLESLIQYFNERKNRVTAVHIGDNEHVRTFRRSMALRKNVGIFSVEKKEDIPKIVLGRIREYFHATSQP
ncbi:MAG: vWA domain-containing protein [Thermodesulfobacteriota bacterium]